jgi:RNA polymerase sigma factor (sigma-70 family)
MNPTDLNVVSVGDMEETNDSNVKSIPVGDHNEQILEIQPTKTKVTQKMLLEMYEKLKSHNLSHIAHRSFKNKNAHKEIVESPVPESSTPRVNRAKLKDLPRYMAALYEKPLLTFDQEQYLFRKMNYLKYLAQTQLEQMKPGKLTLKALKLVETTIAQADEVRQLIIQSNLRLVISISRRFVDATMTFDDLVGEGNLTLMYAVDKFNYSKGFRFSTYATHAVQRGFYRLVNKHHKDNQRMYQAMETEQYEAEAESNQPEIHAEYSDKLYQTLIQQMDSLLDEREKFILMARYGFVGDESNQTLKSLAESMGICKERVRQLQNRALVKLQDVAHEIEKTLPASYALET